MQPRLIVEVRWGKLAGIKAVLQPEQSMQVGRSEIADFEIAHDDEISSLHFELSWDGSKATLKDLGSKSGTLLAGKPIDGEAIVRHGGWVQAGQTHFMMYVEGATAAPEEEFDDDEWAAEERRIAAAKRAVLQLRAVANTSSLYAVVDAARDDRILALLREHVEPHRSLFDGHPGELLEDVAPYLVGPVRDDSALLDKLVLEGWGKRWGIFCATDESFLDARRHWRRFLMIELEDTAERLYFRFYDPGVWRDFWETCNPDQKWALVSPMQGLYAEDEAGRLVDFVQVLADEEQQGTAQ